MNQLTAVAASFLLLITQLINAQSVSITTDGSQPAAGAMLDVRHVAKGVLIPRIALTGIYDSTTVPDRPVSLLIYNTAATGGSDAVQPGYYYWQNGKWNKMMADDQSTLSGWLLGGNKGTTAGLHFIGTKDSSNLQFRVANQFAGQITIEGNTAYGYQASGMYNALHNVAIGRRALYSNWNWYNVAVGDSALYYNTGYNNTATGIKTMLNNTSGNRNTATGFSALFSNTTGILNTAVGASALYHNTQAYANVAVGSQALFSNVNGLNNTSIGTETMLANVDGSNNTATGYRSLGSNTNGSGNSAFGIHALAGNTSGGYNTALGNQSMQFNTAGEYNTAVGNFALFFNTTGNNNVAIGSRALQFHKHGNVNVAIGEGAMASDTSGAANTVIGYGALGSSRYSNFLVAVGNAALAFNTTGERNTAIGSSALYRNTSGYSNTVLGYYAGYNNTTAYAVTAVGDQALSSNTTGRNNTALGAYALSTNTSGILNTAIGSNALTGNNTGSSNTAIGANAEVMQTDLTNATAIGANAAVDCSNCLVLGSNAHVGINYSTPGFPLNFPNITGDKISLYGNSGAHYGFGIQNMLLQIHSDGPGSDIALGYGYSTAFNETFRVKGNGNVTMGISNAAATLTFGQSLSKKIILFKGGSGGEAAIGVFANELRLQSDYSGAGVTFGYDNAGTFVQNFRVQGNGDGVLRGNMYANGVLLTSDKRAKKDISLIEDGLDKITQLNAYHYYWKEDAQDASLQTGVIAQEVQQLFPELVKQTDNGTLTVNYTGLIPYLIQSIKEQQKKIEALEKTNERLLKVERELGEIRRLIKD